MSDSGNSFGVSFDAAAAIASVARFNKALTTQIEQVNRLDAAVSKFNKTWKASAFTSMGKAQQGIDKTSQSLKTAKHQTEQLGKSMNGLGAVGKKAGDDVNVSWQSVYRFFQSRVLISAVQGLISGMKSTISQAAELSQKIAEVQTISQAAGEGIIAQRDRLFAGTQKISDAFGFKQADVIEAQYQAVSNQVEDAAKNFEFLTEAASFAKAGATDLATSVNLLSAVMNSMGIAVSETERVASVLFKTIEFGRIRAEDMAVMFGRSGALAKQLGIDLEELNAAFASMTIQGVRFKTVQTFLNNAMLKLIKPTDTMKGLLQSWGVDSGKAAFATFGFIGTIEKLLKAAREAGGELKDLDELAKQFGTIRAILGVSMLSGDKSREKFKEALAEMKTGIEDYRTAYDLMLKDPGTQFQKGLTEIQNSFINTFGVDMLEMLVKFNSKYNLFVKAIKVTIPLVAILAGLIGGLKLVTIGLTTAKTINAAATAAEIPLDKIKVTTTQALTGAITSQTMAQRQLTAAKGAGAAAGIFPAALAGGAVLAGVIAISVATMFLFSWMVKSRREMDRAFGQELADNISGSKKNFAKLNISIIESTLSMQSFYKMVFQLVQSQLADKISDVRKELDLNKWSLDLVAEAFENAFNQEEKTLESAIDNQKQYNKELNITKERISEATSKLDALAGILDKTGELQDKDFLQWVRDTADDPRSILDEMGGSADRSHNEMFAALNRGDIEGAYKAFEQEQTTITAMVKEENDLRKAGWAISDKQYDLLIRRGYDARQIWYAVREHFKQAESNRLISSVTSPGASTGDQIGSTQQQIGESFNRLQGLRGSGNVEAISRELEKHEKLTSKLIGLNQLRIKQEGQIKKEAQEQNKFYADAFKNIDTAVKALSADPGNIELQIDHEDAVNKLQDALGQIVAGSDLGNKLAEGVASRIQQEKDAIGRKIAARQDTLAEAPEFEKGQINAQIAILEKYLNKLDQISPYGLVDPTGGDISRLLEERLNYTKELAALEATFANNQQVADKLQTELDLIKEAVHERAKLFGGTFGTLTTMQQAGVVDPETSNKLEAALKQGDFGTAKAIAKELRDKFEAFTPDAIVSAIEYAFPGATAEFQRDQRGLSSSDQLNELDKLINSLIPKMVAPDEFLFSFQEMLNQIGAEGIAGATGKEGFANTLDRYIQSVEQGPKPGDIVAQFGDQARDIIEQFGDGIDYDKLMEAIKTGEDPEGMLEKLDKAFEKFTLANTSDFGKIMYNFELAMAKQIGQLATSIDNMPGVRGSAAGGFVPNSPNMSPMGTDSVLTALTPGEFVINRSAAGALGPRLLHQLNMGSLQAHAAGGFVRPSFGTTTGGTSRSASNANNITNNIAIQTTGNEILDGRKIINAINREERRRTASLREGLIY